MELLGAFGTLAPLASDVAGRQQLSRLGKAERRQ